MALKNCELCGTLISYPRRRKYCVDCTRLTTLDRMRRWRRKNKKRLSQRRRETYWKNKKKKHCLLCGTELGFRRRIYCGDECQNQARRDRSRRRWLREKGMNEEFRRQSPREQVRNMWSYVKELLR